LCATQAALQLRLWTIASVVQRLSLWKAASTSGSAVDRHQLFVVSQLYSYCRPLMFTSRDRCLLDALTLMYFLIGRGIRATWVFGVRLEPFRAHCWVQHDNIVLNDTPEHVAAFTPIMNV